MFLLQLLLILNLALVFNSCTQEEHNTINNISNNKEIEIQEKANELSIKDKETLKLKGTCPRGLSCLSPRCGSYSDINDDSACDRGH